MIPQSVVKATEIPEDRSQRVAERLCGDKKVWRWVAAPPCP